jgi:hypothetical protein
MSKNRQTVVTGGNVDVEALFGAQAAKKNKRKSGTRTVPRTSSLTHCDSFALSVKEGSSQHLDAEVVAAKEVEGMRSAEKEQCLSDGFWGLDKECRDRGEEFFVMSHEDARSAENERLWSISTMQRQWEQEEQCRAEVARLLATVQEEHARLAYMEAFFSSQSSGDVLQYPWPTRPEVSPPQPDTDTHTGTAAYKEGYEILCSDFGNISTIHVKGLQRGHEISVGGETADHAQARAVASMAMRQPGTRKPAPSTSTSSGRGKEGAGGTGPLPLRTSASGAPSSPHSRHPHHTLTPHADEEHQQHQHQHQPQWPGGTGSSIAQEQQGSAQSRLLARAKQEQCARGAGAAGTKHNDLYDGHPLYRRVRVRDAVAL